MYVRQSKLGSMKKVTNRTVGELHGRMCVTEKMVKSTTLKPDYQGT